MANASGSGPAPDDHVLRMIRALIVAWASVETGAPMILVSPLEEFRSDAFYADVASRAGIVVASPLSKADRKTIEDFLNAFLDKFEAFRKTARLKPGRYQYTNPLREKSLDWAIPPGMPELATQELVNFEVTQEHLTLLRRASWEGPGVDPKRPYGDLTYYEAEMAEILDLPTKRDSTGALAEPGEEKRLTRLHEETLCALQVFVQFAEPAQ
jgi:hypothetical protein